MRNYSDQILFKKIKRGNELAFKKLFDKYYYQLCMYARTIVKKNEYAEEVVEDVFCKIWQKKDQIDIRVSLKTYLFKSVYNTSLNFLKSEKTYSTSTVCMSDTNEYFPEYSTSGKSITDQIFEDELSEQINLSIESLPDRCREIFKMNRFEGMTYTEIANQLELSVKTVETQMSRALTKLRVQLVEYL